MANICEFLLNVVTYQEPKVLSKALCQKAN